jgi:hypothetical protein
MFEPIPGDHVILKPNDHWDAPAIIVLYKTQPGMIGCFTMPSM